MKWWHLALSFGVAYLFTRDASAADAWGGGAGDPTSGDVIIGTPQVTYPGTGAPTALSADLHQKLATFFGSMYDCAKYSYDDVAEGRAKCCASGRINVATTANGAITIYCIGVSSKVAPQVLLQYPSLAQMYNDIGYLPGFPK